MSFRIRMDSEPSKNGPGNPPLPTGVVELRTFSDPDSAEVARASLEARGIECWLTADDCGGMYAAMDAVQGVKLRVHLADLAAAKALLASETSSPGTPTHSERSSNAPASARTSPRIKLSLPQLITGVVVGVLLCLLYQETAKLGTKTYSYDSDGDGKPDEVWVYKDGRNTEASYDRNLDGKLDNWCHYDSSGRLILTSSDDNFDGVSDGTWYYTNGVVASSHLDTDFNGTPDVITTFRYGFPVQSDWRPNGTNVVTLRQLFQFGNLTEEQRDTNLDGSFDVTIQYGPFQNPIGTNAFKLLSPVSR